MSLRRKQINFQETWESFKQSIVKLLEFTGVDQIRGMELYQLVYEMCVAYPKPYIDEIRISLAQLFVEHVVNIRQIFQSNQEQDIVKLYAIEWEKYHTAVTYINVIFDYYNRLVLKRLVTGIDATSKMTVDQMAYVVWKDAILINFKSLQGNRLINQVLGLIEKDRNDIPCETNYISLTVSSLVITNQHSPQPLQFYIDEYETILFEQTKAYYEKESNLLINSHDIKSFMKKVNKRLNEEKQRAKNYTDSSSYDKFMSLCINEMVGKHQQRYQEEFKEFLEKDLTSELGLFYSLLILIPEGAGIQPILKSLEKHLSFLGKKCLKELGNVIVKDQKPYMDSLLQIYNKYSDLVTKAFRKDNLFEAALDKAFRTIINDTVSNPAAQAPEIIAKYCDFLLRKNTKKNISDVDVEDELARVMILFKYVDDKDVFQKFYSRYLAKRLISNSSISLESEANMISKMKASCGYEYTGKLQRMFTDMTISDDINSKFSKFCSTLNVSLHHMFTVNILTAGAWPYNPPKTEIPVPVQILDHVNNFETFYHKQHSGRKLTWLHYLSRVEIKTNGFTRRYEISMSMIQMMICELYNEGLSYTLQQIEKQISMPMSEIKKHLKPLLDIQLLECEEAKIETANENGIIKLNTSFTHKRTKIKLHSASQTETTSVEREETRQSVEDDRKLYLQAAIVRIMKSRKELAHNMLIQEVIEHSKQRFSPSIMMIKKCIEQLIEKQFLERTQDMKDVYSYVA